ncbi:MAG: DUF2007 domain-containing protein [Anaerolineae bacterium]|nr:DUF2007 domain-containing protein [Anaerolineae bacterium]
MTQRDEEEFSLTPVLTVWDQAEASLIIARLKSQGISAIAGSEAAFNAFPVSVGAISDIKIMVPKTEEEHALEVLRDLGALADQDEVDEND